MQWPSVVAALVAAAGAIGQMPTFTRLGHEQGMPNEQVRCVSGDALGYPWFATSGRPCRHDGVRFVPWPEEAAPPERIDRIAHATDGRTWLGGAGPRLWVHEPARTPCFREIAVRSADVGRNVAALTVDRDDHLLIATESGLFAANVTDAACTLAPIEPDPRNRWYGALATDAHGAVLYARTGLALRIAGNEIRRVELPKSEGNVWAIVPIDADKCRALTDGVILEVDWRTQTSRTLDAPRSQHRFSAMAATRDGALWVGSTGALWRSDGTTWTEVVADTWIRSLFVDRSGNLWAGTQNQGVLFASAQPFAALRARTKGASLVRVVRTPDTTLIAEETSGLLCIDGERLVPSRFAELSELRTGSTVVADAAGNLWFGDRSNLRLVPADQVRGATLAPRTWPIPVHRLLRDALGHALCTTRDAAITLQLDAGGELAGATTPVPTADRGAYAIGGDGHGVVYVCDADGTLQIATRDRRVPLLDRGKRLQVRRVEFGEDGSIWIVPFTGAGVAVTDAPLVTTSRLRWIGPADGLPDSRVEALSPSGSGAWLALTGGLCHFDRATGTTRAWSWPTGIGGGSIQDLTVEPSGRVLIAFEDRLLTFDPARRVAAAPGRVVVTNVLVAGAVIPLPDGGATALPPLTTPAGQGDVVVTWRTPGHGLLEPPVQYRLSSAAPFGPPAATPVLQLAGLASGEHRLELRIAAHDGQPPGPVTAIDLHVRAPFWARTEFVVLVAFATLLAAFAWHRARVRRFLAMEAIRRQISTDLHDDLGSGLAQVAVLSEIGKREAPPAAAALDEIGGLARSMRESMSDIVWAVDPTQDTLSAVVQRLRQVANNLFGDSEVDVHFAAPDAAAMDAIALRPDRRRHLFLFCKEALTNVARHASARSVSISFERANGVLRVAISDDGRGFDVDATHGGHGCRGMRERATALHSRLSMRSTPGRGTSIELRIPD